MKFIKKIFYSGLAIVVAVNITVSLTGCSPEEINENMVGLMEKTTGPIQPDKMLAGSMWRNSDIEGAVSENIDVSVKDDFHTAVNKDWLLQADNKSGTASPFLYVDLALEEQVMSLFQPGDNSCDTGILPQQEADHLKDLLVTMTGLAIDWDTRNSLGVEPLRPYLETIEGIGSLEELTDYLCDRNQSKLLRENFLNAVVSEPVSSRDRYTVHLTNIKHLLLEDAQQYRSISDDGCDLLNCRRDAVCTVLERLGYTRDEADTLLDRCLWLEVRLTRDLPTNTEYNNIRYEQHMDNVCTIEELAARQGNFPLTALLDAADLGDSASYLLYEPLYLDTLSKVYTESRLEDFKAYFVVHTVLEALPLLDEDSYALAESIDAVLNIDSLLQTDEESGDDGDEPDPPIPTDTQTEEKVGFDDEELENAVSIWVVPYLSGVVQELYVARFCRAQTKRDLSELIDEIVDCYGQMLRNEDWLSEETRKKAIEKLDAIKVRVLYPDKLTDYSDLNILSSDDGGTLLDAVAAANAFNDSLRCEKVNRMIDRADWDMSQLPTTEVNAYYVPAQNTINILAGMLAGDCLYDPDGTREQQLASLGSIVAHEISHAFDTTGYLYDSEGLKNTWWTSEDEVAFQLRAGRVVNYYNTLSVLPGVTGGYAGNTVKGEAIADMGAVKCMLLLAKQDPEFDYETFFTEYARLWRIKNDYIGELQSMSDKHPLNFLRTNVTLQQFEEFYETFDIGPGDGMYLAPKDRVAVW